MTWKNIKLINLAKITMGQSPLSRNYNDNKNGLPLIQGNNDIKNFRTNEKVWTSQITKTANEGDIILTVRAPVGELGFAITKVCIGRGVCSIKPYYSKKFLFYSLLNYKSKWKQLEQGSTFSAINSNDLRSVSLSIPSIKEQEGIVDVLETWDEVVEKLEEKIKLKKNIKKGLMQQLLTGKTRLPGFAEILENYKNLVKLVK
ncbi:MAG: restriction endonuclease subunit S [Thermales bacterium]|nr:restriction endonuclease subunit S [Thermales bacterium]